MAGLDIDVEALEGAGDYHLEARIIGTTQLLAREAILSRPVLLQIECMFRRCTFRYDGLEMRGDGRSFPLKFTPTAGFTYYFNASLRESGAGEPDAAHLSFAIYPPESITTTDEFGSPDSLGCDIPSVFAEPTHDVDEI
eukprot:SAG31_NODE_6846_length_1871_cov_1.184537_1_plen_138_part_10